MSEIAIWCGFKLHFMWVVLCGAGIWLGYVQIIYLGVCVSVVLGCVNEYVFIFIFFSRMLPLSAMPAYLSRSIPFWSLSNAIRNLFSHFHFGFYSFHFILPSCCRRHWPCLLALASHHHKVINFIWLHRAIMAIIICELYHFGLAWQFCSGTRTRVCVEHMQYACQHSHSPLPYQSSSSHRR